MNTSKKGVRLIAEICRQKGIRKVVFSPGSRSAPLVIAFSQIPEIECIVIPDERVAGYFALGMAQQLRETVAVVCTSGTAVLNLAPAVCEAYYHKISLLVLTADRPEGAEKRGENQAIIQEDIFKPFAFCRTVNGDAETKEELKIVIEETARSIYECRNPDGNPQQLNIRLSEPLYETSNELTPTIEVPEIEYIEQYGINLIDARRIAKTAESFEKKMIIVGTHNCESAFLKTIEKLNQRADIVIIHENLTDLKGIDSVCNLDSCIALLKNQQQKTFIPDIVITLGNQIVSKKLKQFLKDKPKVHWDVPTRDVFGRNRDMFGVLDEVSPINEEQFLDILLKSAATESSNFKKDWLALSKMAEEKSKKYFSSIPFSDLKVFETLIESFPNKANIQYGNSTPIRYSNLFEHKKSLTVNANRGTSGIDGCVSTAAGAAYVASPPTPLRKRGEKQPQMTISVVGDISFFYDSNALWNNYLSTDFRIIIINNSGGNIFRLIDGPTRVNNFEKFFETKHNLSAKHLASMYDLPYYFCDSQKGLDEVLKTFYKPQKGKPAILEIKTDGELSADVYKKYFEYLRNK